MALRRASLADECGFCHRATPRLALTAVFLTRSGRRDAQATAAAAAGFSRRVSYDGVFRRSLVNVYAITDKRENGAILATPEASVAKLSSRQARFSRGE